MSVLPRPRLRSSASRAMPAPSQYSSPDASTATGLPPAASWAASASVQTSAVPAASRRPLRARTVGLVSERTSREAEGADTAIRRLYRQERPESLADLASRGGVLLRGQDDDLVARGGGEDHPLGLHAAKLRGREVGHQDDALPHQLG